MPLGKICWRLWFSSMITRILRGWPDPAAPPGPAVGCCAPAVPVAAVVAEEAPPAGAEEPGVPWAEEQPATRRLPINTAQARPGPARKWPVSEVRSRHLLAW